MCNYISQRIVYVINPWRGQDIYSMQMSKKKRRMFFQWWWWLTERWAHRPTLMTTLILQPESFWLKPCIWWIHIHKRYGWSILILSTSMCWKYSNINLTSPSGLYFILYWRGKDIYSMQMSRKTTHVFFSDGGDGRRDGHTDRRWWQH